MSPYLLFGVLFLGLASRKLLKMMYTLPISLATVDGPQKEHWLTGNLHRLYKDGLSYTMSLCRTYGGAIRLHGVLGAQNLLVHDPLALQYILVKDQDAFEETDMFIESNKMLLGQGLISTLGEQHKKQRRLLNPVFSLANLRHILPGIQPIADELIEGLRRSVPQDGASSTEMNILPWLQRGTLEYVARGILGVKLSASLEPTDTDAYTHALCNIQHVGLRLVFLRPFVPWVVRTVPLYWRKKLVDLLPFPAVRELRDMADVMRQSATVILLRKKAEVEQAGEAATEDTAGDLMTIMLRANLSTQEKARLTSEELIGQINTFLMAGQETTTNSLAKTLYVLAREPLAQARLRREVREAKIEHARALGVADPPNEWTGVCLPYDVLVGLPYLDAVVRETLRLHPPTSFINRLATKDAVLPLQRPIRSATGSEISSVPVPAGTNIIINILGSNRNPDVWGPDAEEWRPERWLALSGERLGQGKSLDLDFDDEESGSAASRHKGYSGVCETTTRRKGNDGVRYPGVYGGGMMTFLGGNRACIGFKFAEMEIKQILSTLVSTMHFALPSAVDSNGVRKEIYWSVNGLQVPLVRPPHGDGKTPQVPLDVRRVTEADFF
ncbi:cytochrome P450 [Pilatotrama ljubarskyi]|nr:cytochrome P450 [Pilatotrama ljubarskyi]